MGIPKVHFPHITRVFSAFLWFLLVAFFITNLSARLYSPSPLSQALLPSLINPFSISQHVTTAKKLWDSGYKKTATRELVLATDLVKSGGSVLGATSDPKTLLSQWQSEPSKLRDAYEYWTSVTRQQPDYRDGFLMAGGYAYQLGNMTSAKQLFEKAYTLDPNYKPTLEMLKKTEE
jgi:hypothetical protein